MMTLEASSSLAPIRAARPAVAFIALPRLSYFTPKSINAVAAVRVSATVLPVLLLKSLTHFLILALLPLQSPPRSCTTAPKRFQLCSDLIALSIHFFAKPSAAAPAAPNASAASVPRDFLRLVPRSLILPPADPTALRTLLPNDPIFVPAELTTFPTSPIAVLNDDLISAIPSAAFVVSTVTSTTTSA